MSTTSTYMQSPTQTMHGVMLKIHDVGVLLQGESGIGKSEIAWRLLQRGHTLISDDIVLLTNTTDKIIASCPEEKYVGQLSLRQLGIINVRDYCDKNAVALSQPLQLIIQLQNTATIPETCITSTERYDTVTLFQQEIPSLTLALSNIMDPAHSIEIAARQYQYQHQQTVKPESTLALSLLSFGYKYGVPKDRDFIIDVRCLPNPYWEKSLSASTGQDIAVRDFLEQHPSTPLLCKHIATFIEAMHTHFKTQHRSYLNIGIGCTGGQHRSVYVIEQLQHIFQSDNIVTHIHHRELNL